MEDVLLLDRRPARRGRAGRRPGPPPVQVVRRRRVPGRLARSSRRCSTSGSAAATSSASSATRPRRSTPSPAPTPPTCATSRRKHPGTTSIELVRNYRSTPRGRRRPPTRCWPASSSRGRRAARPAPVRARGRATPPSPTRSPRPRRSPTRSPRCATQGRPLGEVAVLFRINAQSEAFEEALAARGAALRRPRRGPLLRPCPRCAQAVTRLRGAARSGGGADELARGRARHARRHGLDRPRRPTARGQTRDRWESWQALVDQADEFARTPGADAGRLRRRPRPPGRRAARAGRRRRHPRHAARGQGPGVGRGVPVRAPGRHPADHLRRHPGRDRGGAPAALRRDDPRPARPVAVLGPGPQPRRPGVPQALPVPDAAAAAGDRAPSARGRPATARSPAAASAASR